ncbi:breast cancer type 1 susceptibility protein homolog isoform X2 [Leptopilina boulardi]|uniref:breast cancer type 1 susceptibility protein homolog isoform X2 n=1 Tax=Leptopilina boulardi TaxID=63433 RepID=UPI0021F5C668|nr:breast cancer type 1 susceptibility protein homolog isoform X2 [Leptopilina boulardi]
MSKKKEDAIEKLSDAICVIRKSLTCSICLGLCTDPYTPRCGHPFCQKCIIEVMGKRSAQCPMCNGVLTRRTLIRNNQLNSIIEHLHKIEDAIKIDINLGIADYEASTLDSESTDKNMLTKTLKIQGTKSCNKMKCLDICNTRNSQLTNVSKSNVKNSHIIIKPKKYEGMNNSHNVNFENNFTKNVFVPEHSSNSSFNGIGEINCSEEINKFTAKDDNSRNKKSNSAKILQPQSLTLAKDSERHSFQDQQFENVIATRSKLDGIIKCPETHKLVPFKKLGRMFRKQKQIPFYYISKLSKIQNEDKGKDNSIPILVQRSKDLKTNFCVTNLSDSGISKTKENLSTDISKVNDSIQNFHPVEMETLELVFPQNDSQLKDLSLDVSKVNDNIQSSHAVELKKLDLIPPQNDSQLKHLSIDTPEEKREFLNSRNEVNNSQEESKFHQSEKYKKILDESDLDINTEQFKELENLPHFTENIISVETEIMKEKNDSEKFPQNSDSSSIIPCSLNQPFEKPPAHTIKSFQTNSLSPESEDLASHFFADVIEKSKDIRRKSCVNAVTRNEETSMQLKSDLMLLTQDKTDQNVSQELITQQIITSNRARNIEKQETSSLVKKIQNSSVAELSQLFTFNDKFNQNDSLTNETNKNKKEKKQTQPYDKDVSYVSEKADLLNLSNLSMNVSEEQMMLEDFEKQLFGVKTCQEKCASLFPDNIKQSISTFDANAVDLRSSQKSLSDHDFEINTFEKKKPSRFPDNIKQSISTFDANDVDLRSSQKSLSDHDFEINTFEKKKPSPQTGVKRKSCPLYHSTPKVLKLGDNSRMLTTSLNVGTSSEFQNCGTLCKESTTENFFQKKEKLTFVCSGLSSSQIQMVRQLSELVNANFISTFNSTVTHVIVKVIGQRNTTEKTLKYLQGIAYGKWIVTIDWVNDSLKNQKMLDEDKYEVVDNLTLEEGPKKSRLRTKSIFEGFICLCQGPFNDVSVADYSDLLTHMGAKILQGMEDFIDSNYKNKRKIIILQADHWTDNVINID